MVICRRSHPLGSDRTTVNQRLRVADTECVVVLMGSIWRITLTLHEGNEREVKWS